LRKDLADRLGFVERGDENRQLFGTHLGIIA
jgi:hypothetical protein